MSTLEIGILLAMGLVLLIANVHATFRTLRYFGAYGFPYLIVIWAAPLVGALFVLAKLRPRTRSAFAVLGANTLAFSHNPLTIPADTDLPKSFRK